MKTSILCSLVLGLATAMGAGCAASTSSIGAADQGNGSGTGSGSAGTGDTSTGHPGSGSTQAHPDAGEAKPGSGSGSGTNAGDEADAGTPSTDAGAVDAGGSGASLGQTIATIALANVGEGACSTNSAGGSAFETSCTGNDGSPEYWCADFVQWVWAQAGVDTDGLDAAAGSFYVYGQNNNTLHSTPSLGDAVVFDYTGDGVATHVAIVIQLNADGTIETTSGDWNGDNGTEAQFASTSLVVLNSPAYAGVQGSVPDIMGMTISGFVSPAGSGGSASSDAGTGGAGCYSDTLSMEMPDNACVQSASDDTWYQCDNGSWVDRDTDPTACNGTYPLS
jgi:hypothetical protein